MYINKDFILTQAQYNYYIQNNFLNIIKYSISTQLSHKYFYSWFVQIRIHASLIGLLSVTSFFLAIGCCCGKS